jgi:hypothetical protein
MIWDKKLVVAIVPSVGVVAFLGTYPYCLSRRGVPMFTDPFKVTGIGAIHAFATDTTDTVFTGKTRSWVSAMLCITLFTKLVCFGKFI